MKTNARWGFACLILCGSGLAQGGESWLFEREPEPAPSIQTRIQSPATPHAELEQIARSGNSDAQYRLGMRYFRGENNESPDPVRAAPWLRKAAESGHAQAALQLGLMHRDGRGVTRDPKLARIWFNAAANRGLAIARSALEDLYSRVDQEEFERMRVRAIRGDARAQYQLGHWYRTGDGPVPADADEASSWLRRAAQLGFAEAEYEYGMLLRNSPDSERSAEAALLYLKRAAGQGLLKARVAVQDIERERQRESITASAGLRDLSRGAFYEAAKAGDANAQYELGLMYFNGNAVPRDTKQGVYWLRRAAQQNHVPSQLFLADRYARGIDVDNSYTEAAGWYGRAARLGNPEAQFRLADMFRLGLGVTASADAAKYWYTEAARQGHAKARQFLAGQFTAER